MVLSLALDGGSLYVLSSLSEGGVIRKLSLSKSLSKLDNNYDLTRVGRRITVAGDLNKVAITGILIRQSMDDYLQPCWISLI